MTISDAEMSELVHERVPGLVPATFEALLTFAESYDAPQNVEAVFKWDVEDIFYNYFFAGNYMDIGGMCGDSKDSVDIYNEEAIRALMVYQDLLLILKFLVALIYFPPFSLYYLHHS